jgi:hypothetical protein
VGYGRLITEGFQIALRNRYLWFFGLFAGTPSINFQVQVPIDPGGGEPSQSSNGGSADLDPAVLVAIVLATLVLFVVIAALFVIAQGALTDSVAAIHRGERRGFRAAWRAGRSRFWRVLGLWALTYAIAFGLFVAVLVPLAGAVIGSFALTEAVAVRVVAVIWAVLIAVIALFAIFVPLAVVMQHAIRELVLRGAPVVVSLRGGWQLSRQRLGHSLLLLLIQQGIMIAGGLAVLLAAAVLALPAIVLLVTDAGTAATVAVIAAVVLVVPLVLAAYGAIGTFSHGLWTLGYLRLAFADSPDRP